MRYKRVEHFIQRFFRPPLLLLLACVVIGLGSPAPMHGQEVKVYVSSEAGARLSPQPDLHFESQSGVQAAVFTVKDRVRYQKIDGFGASLLEAGGSGWIYWNMALNEKGGP